MIELDTATDFLSAPDAVEQASEDDLPALRDGLDGPAPQIFAALWALGNLLTRNPALAGGDWSAVISRLIALCDEPDVWLRGQAVRVLGRLKASGAVGKLTALLSDEAYDATAAPIWVIAADALQMIDTSQSQTAVEAACQSRLGQGHPKRQAMAAQFLERSPRPSARAKAAAWHLSRLESGTRGERAESEQIIERIGSAADKAELQRRKGQS